MKLLISRIIAILMLVIPGIVACFGFLKMKDSLFEYYIQFGQDHVTPKLDWLELLIGFIMFFAGVGFIAGWVFYRDRKRNYVAPRFKKKRPRPEKPNSIS